MHPDPVSSPGVAVRVSVIGGHTGGDQAVGLISLVQLESCFQVFLEGPGAARCVLEYLMLVIISLQTLAPLGTSDTSFTLIDLSLPEVID